MMSGNSESRLKIPDKILFKFIDYILESENGIDYLFDGIETYFTDSRDNILACLIFVIVRHMDKNKELLATYESNVSRPTSVPRGAVSIYDSIRNSTFADDKVIAVVKEPTYNNDIHRTIALAEYCAYSMSTGHKEFWNDVVTLFSSKLDKLDITEFDSYSKSDISDAVLDAYSVLSCYSDSPSYENYYPLFRVCAFVFDMKLYCDSSNEDRNPNLARSVEYIIQQFIVTKLRQFLSNKHKNKEERDKYRGIEFSISDAARTLRVGNKIFGSSQCDAFLKVSKKISKKKSQMFYGTVFDVKTNLEIVTNSGSYAHERYQDQIYKYVGNAKSLVGLNDIDGILFHVVFNNTSNWSELHKYWEDDGNIRFAVFVLNFDGDDYDDEKVNESIAELYDFLEIDKKIAQNV